MKKTIVIVAGGRDFANRRRPGAGMDIDWHRQCWKLMDNALSELLTDGEGAPPHDLVIRHGAAKGADSLAAEWAMYKGILTQDYPANWDKYGKRAGFVRNEEMTKGATALIAFWDGQSRGTKHMIDTATAQGLDVHVYRYQPATQG